MKSALLTTPAPPTSQKLMTAEEAAQLSTVNRRFELVKGEYTEMSPASKQHGKVANRIAFMLTQHVADNDLGEVTAAETGFLLSRQPDSLRAADTAFISKARAAADDISAAYWTVAPDLAVEVASPSDSPDEIQEKVEEYLAAGTRMVWVVYPRRQSVAVYRSLRDVKILRGDDTLSGEDVLPGFERKVNEIFE